MTNNSQQQSSSPPLPPLPASAYTSPSPPLLLPSSASSSPKTSFSSRFKSKPQAIAIHNSNSSVGLEPSQPSPRRGSIAAHLMNFATRSTTSLQLLSSSAPAHHGSGLGPSASTTSLATQEEEMRSQVLPLRSTAFSNPFKKLQHTFHGSGSKKTPDGQKIPERIVSSSASAQSMTSWRSKGAEMLSKKTWGRTRKNSEPTYAGQGVLTAPIFGSTIDDAVRISHIPGTPMVPAVLYRCAEFLESKGVDEVGLYRVPGSHASVQKLKRLFDSGKDHNLMTMDGIDPNDIATLLKLYLRELPSPLLPAIFLEQFQSLISTDRQICHSLRGILIRLPRSNYVLLSFLCHHLSRIASHADKTKMNVSNLGVVFAPTLSIGSILFKALLGGFYDSEDTAESREKGLKLVWGGLLQDFEYDGVTDWSDVHAGGEASQMPLPHLYQTGPLSPQHPLSPAQEIVAQSLAVPSASTGLGFTQSLPNDHHIPSSMTLSREDDEANLLAAMVLREERAAAAAETHQDDDTCSNASEESMSSVDRTDNTALSTMSSPGTQHTKDQAFEASFTSPSMAFSPTLPATSFPASASSHLISTASVPTDTTTTNSLTLDLKDVHIPSTVAIPNVLELRDEASKVAPEGHCQKDEEEADGGEQEEEEEEEEEDGEEEEEEDVAVPEFPHKSASGAPQLPPLEGLMIAL